MKCRCLLTYAVILIHPEQKTTSVGCPTGKRCLRTGPDGSRCAGAIIEHGNAHEDFVDTICAYIENWLFGFCWAFQSFRKRCSQYQNRTTGAEDMQKYRFGSLATNTRTGRPEPPAQQHSPEQHQSASYWSGRALEIHVLTLMGAVRQYQSHTAGNLSKPNIAPVI